MRARAGDFGAQGLSRVFLDGQEEFKKACSAGDNADLILEGVRRAMDAAMQRENVFLGAAHAIFWRLPPGYRRISDCSVPFGES